MGKGRVDVFWANFFWEHHGIWGCKMFGLLVPPTSIRIVCIYYFSKGKESISGKLFILRNIISLRTAQSCQPTATPRPSTKWGTRGLYVLVHRLRRSVVCWVKIGWKNIASQKVLLLKRVSLSEDLRFEHVPAVPDRQSCAQRFTSHALPQDSNDTATAVYLIVSVMSMWCLLKTWYLWGPQKGLADCYWPGLLTFIGRAFSSVSTYQHCF